MQRIAADVGYSETVFATPEQDRWRIRYFAPEAEVEFCGHATIALGAVQRSEYSGGRSRVSQRVQDRRGCQRRRPLQCEAT
jgi:PhzF family phenazine biosynthesis protein